jgi:hypothetical protein
MRELPEFSLDEQKQENLANWVQAQRLSGAVDISERWRGQSPRQPMIDMNLFRQPAPAEIPGQ